MERNKERGDVQAVAVNDIWDKRKKRARDARPASTRRSVYHDYREVCARPDVDVVVIASPDHWHHAHTMEALRNGQGRLPREADDLHRGRGEGDRRRGASERPRPAGRQPVHARWITSGRRKKAIDDGLLGEVVWASGGFGRNRNQRGEWNYAIDPEATEKTLDWKAFIGSAPKRPFDPERYFRWRKYWDYSGGIATDLFYHTVSPLLLTIGVEFPLRVTASGGIYVQKDREVPDTFFMNVDYPGVDDAAGVLGGERRRRAARHPRQPGHAVRRAEQREPQQHRRWRSCPTRTTATSSRRRPASRR